MAIDGHEGLNLFSLLMPRSAYLQRFKAYLLLNFQYRMSPFMNTRVAQKTKDTRSRHESNDDDESYNDNAKKSYGWFRLVDSSRLQEKYFHAVMSLNKSLHGFLVFEVVWRDVHGINYLNEIQVSVAFALVSF